MKNKELIDRLDIMLIRTIADIDNEWEGQEIGECEKDETREAHKEIKKIIETYYYPMARMTKYLNTEEQEEWIRIK